MKRLTLTTFIALSFIATPSLAQQSPNYAEHLDRDMAMAAVITVSPSGDIDLFGGSVIVPLTRPSIEKCGEHMSRTAAARTAARRRVRSSAKDHAIKNRFSARERHQYSRKAAAPLKACETKFKTRCQEIRSSVTLEIRTAAIEQAKKSIEKLAKGPREKEAVAAYLEHILEACPLTE